MPRLPGSETSIFTMPSLRAERGLQRVGQPRSTPFLHDEPVDHDLDVVLLLLVERRSAPRVRAPRRRRGRARSPGAEARCKSFAVLALAAAHDRRQDDDARALGQRHARGRRSAARSGCRDLAAALRGSAACRPARRAGAGSRRSRSPCRRSSAGCCDVVLLLDRDGRARGPRCESTSGFSICSRNCRA